MWRKKFSKFFTELFFGKTKWELKIERQIKDKVSKKDFKQLSKQFQELDKLVREKVREPLN